MPAEPNIPPPGPVANIGAPNTLSGLAEPGELDPVPGEEDPNALKDEMTLRGGEAGDPAPDIEVSDDRGGEAGCSGDEGVGGAPGTGRRGGSLPPGV